MNSFAALRFSPGDARVALTIFQTPLSARTESEYRLAGLVSSRADAGMCDQDLRWDTCQTLLLVNRTTVAVRGFPLLRHPLVLLSTTLTLTSQRWSAVHGGIRPLAISGFEARIGDFE